MKLITSLPNYNQARHQASVATMSASQLPNAHTPQADAQRSGAHGKKFLSPYRKFTRKWFWGGFAGGLFFLSPGLFGAVRDANLSAGFLDIIAHDCPAFLRLIKLELKEPSLKDYLVLLKNKQDLSKELEERCNRISLP